MLLFTPNQCEQINILSEIKWDIYRFSVSHTHTPVILEDLKPIDIQQANDRCSVTAKEVLLKKQQQSC